MVYKTKGTCSSEIEYAVENGILTDIHTVLYTIRTLSLCKIKIVN